ncbi:hypothetical protein DL769_010642 [Monosporascus sp. CRB-8-3]|nr:hypothetical protein DL769_010642 [Monosporascus sp. CRB-8-3]
MKFTTVFLAILLASVCHVLGSAPKPNIVFVFTDDQDYRHGSLDTQKAVQEHLIAKGTLFTNHYATVSVCCPSRVSLLRGQAAHNTNNTHISAPGGGYPKFVASAEDNIGKLFNGNSLLNYSPAPKGWTHIDVLLDPYINFHNSVVMSENGARPKWYRNYQQTDVVRIKALARLESLVQQEKPFFLMISPTAPHVQNRTDPPTPPARYLDSFPNITLPRPPNFNPPDEFQNGKPSWLRSLPRLNQAQMDEIDHLYRRRLDSLRGVDDIVEDVVKMLEDNNILNNTYLIYSTDNGYHLGTHRHGSGKSLPYAEDTNIPLVVRGPGVQEGAVSHIPSTLTDLAPTFLEIAGLAPKDQPPFLDGASLLEAWKNPHSSTVAKKKEAINVEFWGNGYTEIPTWEDGDFAPYFPGLYLKNNYKTMRIVGENYAWVYSRWCTNDTELYNTILTSVRFIRRAQNMDLG